MPFCLWRFFLCSFLFRSSGAVSFLCSSFVQLTSYNISIAFNNNSGFFWLCLFAGKNVNENVTQYLCNSSFPARHVLIGRPAYSALRLCEVEVFSQHGKCYLLDATDVDAQRKEHFTFKNGIREILDWVIVRLIDWLIDRLLDWSIGRLVGWLIDSSFFILFLWLMFYLIWLVFLHYFLKWRWMKNLWKCLFDIRHFVDNLLVVHFLQGPPASTRARRATASSSWATWTGRSLPAPWPSTTATPATRAFPRKPPTIVPARSTERGTSANQFAVGHWSFL